jgi:hypothetical protein
MTLTIRNVSESERLEFFPRHFGPMAMMTVEARVFHYARQSLRDERTGEPAYAGGVWEFSEASNGAGWMWPRSVPERVDLGPVGELGGDVRGLSRVAAGLALTCIAVNHELWRLHEEQGDCAATRKLDEQWRLLMEAASECDEAGKILEWLD